MAATKNTTPPHRRNAFKNPLQQQPAEFPQKPAYRAPEDAPARLVRPKKASDTTAHPADAVPVHVTQQECYDAILLYTESLDRIAVEVRAASSAGDQGRVDALLTRARRLEAVRDRFGVALARAAAPR